MLTQKQKDLLDFLDGYVGEKGIAPSYDEMKDALGLKSKSGIHRLMTALEERGFIRRIPNRARALEIIRRPGETVGVELAPLPPARARATKPRPVPVRMATTAKVPIMGRIAAGVPISAIQLQSGSIEVPIQMLGQGEHFALVVHGDSMIEVGINDGDTVLLRRTERAENGDIVVALVDDEEATLKRYRSRAGRVFLEPANAAYETRTFAEDRVKVQGKLSGLLRVY